MSATECANDTARKVRGRESVRATDKRRERATDCASRTAQLIKLLDTSDGRDKVYRLAVYSSRLTRWGMDKAGHAEVPSMTVRRQIPSALARRVLADSLVLRADHREQPHGRAQGVPPLQVDEVSARHGRRGEGAIGPSKGRTSGVWRQRPTDTRVHGRPAAT